MKFFTLLGLFTLLTTTAWAQPIYVDQFDNDDPAFLGGSGTYSFEESNGELNVTAASPAPFDVFTYQPHDMAANEAITVDATGNNKVFVRAKASNVGISLRMDLQDSEGFTTNNSGISKILTTDFQVLEFDFTGNYFDGGFGGPCTSAPCPVDGTDIATLIFFTEPGVGGFNGTVVIDYIAFGEEPDQVIMSDVFQDHMDTDSSITNFASAATYSLTRDGSELTIGGDGTNPMWDPLVYLIRNPTTFEEIDIDISGNNKMFIKIKSTVPNTAFRVDVLDIDGFANTLGSITKLVGTDFTVLEFDFGGTYEDQGFGGTPCTMDTAPCPVDPTRIRQLNMFIEPGVGEFLGDLTIDYISFGTSLEPAGPVAEFLYEDNFADETLTFTEATPGFAVSEAGSELAIEGDGGAAPFAAISYILHDQDTNDPIVLNLEPAQNKVFVRARTAGGNVPLRVDLIDTTGLTTSQASLTKIVTDEYTVLEYNFTANYFDGGFGGTPCDMGPCDVDPTAISQMLFYLDPVTGGYDGTVFIDYVSVGQPGENNGMDNGGGGGGGGGVGPVGVNDYSDQMDDNTALFVEDAAGTTSSFANDIWTITADGSTGAFQPISYELHTLAGDSVIVNTMANDNKLFLRARASEAVDFRVDLQDNQGFVTNANARRVTLTTEFEVYELDYTSAYSDGGFGGTPCTAGPCPVDAERIEFIQFFLNDATGGFDGTVEIDWLSFGDVITDVTDVTRLEQLHAFPNPVTDELNLTLTTAVRGEVQVLLVNATGQTLRLENLGFNAAGNQTTTLNVSDLPAGMYSAVVLVGGVRAGFVKFVK